MTSKAIADESKHEFFLLPLDISDLYSEGLEAARNAALTGQTQDGVAVVGETWTVAERLPSGFDPLRFGLVLSNLVGGVSVSSVEELRESIKEGISKSAFERLADVIGIPQKQLATVIGVNMRTLARRQHLVRDEAERLLRVANVFQETVEAMKELDASRQWFKTPQRALGDHTPLEYCDTEIGAQEVTDLLGRIRHGVFS